MEAENDDRELNILLLKIFIERGLNFKEYKTASLRRRIQKRLDANGLSSYPEYIIYLDQHPGEYDKLFDTLFINVTEFFRDSEAWDKLNEVVIPDILARKSKGDPVRAWCASCSSGEEPYSLAMLLSERLNGNINEHEITIYATDIDEGALAEARKGRYGPDKIKNVRQEFIDKYFTRDTDVYKISRKIRQMVIFGKQNLVMDPPISHLDLIVCRNVLIYFNSDLQQKVMQKFNYSLNDEGYIFFGKSESILLGSKLFRIVDKNWRIFQKSSDLKAEESSYNIV
jgi:two-component system, chemotaxis family, CheB/CheR fusion protein